LKDIRIYYAGLKYLLILFICLTVNQIYGQDKEKLRDLQSRARQEIEYASKILGEIKEKKKYSINELKILEYRINARNKYIKELAEEIEDLNKKITDNRNLIASLEADLIKIKEEYARIIVNAYKKREQNVLLMYILASESFDQAYKRVRYIQQYSEYKKKQAKLIFAFKNIIEKKIVELNRDKDAKARIIKEKESENINIVREKATKEDLIGELSKRENELVIELEEKRKLADKIKKELEKLIEEERNKQKGTYTLLTPEEQLISDNFEKNAGKLPWPVKYGIITGKYGEQDHPVLKNIKIRNDGIDISTVRDAEVRAVFNGKVSKIFTIPGENYTVILRHGNYYTLYHNLKNISVSPGETVYTKQKIGNVYTDEKTKQTILHFQIWKESQNNNPELWLSN
jgi:septal ring factor EnvC (AmiA/AmiB activator)